MKKGGKVVDRLSTVELYKEWTLLIAEAKKIGLQPNDVREFFREAMSKSKKQ